MKPMQVDNPITRTETYSAIGIDDLCQQRKSWRDMTPEQWDAGSRLVRWEGVCNGFRDDDGTTIDHQEGD